METTIRLKPSELNDTILDMVKLLVEKKGFNEISISLSNGQVPKRLRRESPEKVSQKISNALNDIESGNVAQFISFSAEEFEQFSKSLARR